VQAGSVPGEGYGFLARIGFQREDDFLGWDVRLQGREPLWCRPAGFFGQDLRCPPRPFVGAAQEDLYLRDDAAQPAGRSPELLFAFRG
jgi:hypothetical protein